MKGFFSGCGGFLGGGGGDGEGMGTGHGGTQVTHSSQP